MEEPLQAQTIERDGFSNFSDMNKSLLAKLGWSILTKLNSFWASSLINKYDCRANWLERNGVSNDTSTRKGNVKCNEVLSQGVCFWMRDSRAINVWTNP